MFSLVTTGVSRWFHIVSLTTGLFCGHWASLCCLLCLLFYRPLTIQDQPAWCLSWEGLQRARTLAWQWFLRQVSATSPPDAMTTGVAAGCPRNGVVHGAGQHPVCRTGTWKTHWGSNLEALCCPEKRKGGRRKCIKLKKQLITHLESQREREVENDIK